MTIRAFSSTGESARDPLHRCDDCGVVGTVGRAARTEADGTLLEVHRYCAACWPEEAARLQARWAEESRLARDAWLRSPEDEDVPQPPSRGASFEAATWHMPLQFVRQLRLALRSATPPSAADMSNVADEIAATAPELEGQMPLEVELFVREYARGSL